jgi:hypothetical protein
MLVSAIRYPGFATSRYKRVLVQQRSVKCEIDLEDREMFEVLLDAVNREYFFDRRSSGSDFGAFGYVAPAPVLRINLSKPAGLTVTGRTNEDLGMNYTAPQQTET